LLVLWLVLVAALDHLSTVIELVEAFFESTISVIGYHLLFLAWLSMIVVMAIRRRESSLYDDVVAEGRALSPFTCCRLFISWVAKLR
jgi:hypothetical protein